MCNINLFEAVQVLTVNVSAEVNASAELCDARIHMQVLKSVEEMDQLVCFWKFGPQCPTSPLLPPRKAPLEDFDGYRLLPESSGFLAGLVVSQYKFWKLSRSVRSDRRSELR
ncbi:hypothetical protein F511_24044 [Dorcoceras hygrometricum]|uniref:Uncharacterized protein n=1 Tax=Dorcoceras hygrometricum TaxID=472368 RepID=A0A2Z7B700_9LAMI|nr:hypothetical protein F511_24044 [Dorcoceras hygrometricum]